MDKYFYMEVDENGNIVSWGCVSNQDQALSVTKETVCQISEREYNVLVVLDGKLNKGYEILNSLRNDANQVKERNRDW